MPPIINHQKCTGCKTCVTVCPMDVFGYQPKDRKVPLVQFPEECWHCNACVIDCPAKAVTLRVPLSSMVVFTEPLKRE